MNMKVLLRRLIGYRDCPVCGSNATLKTVKDIVVFYDEPPMFYHWNCTNCKVETPPLPTSITKKAAESVGIDLSKPPEDWK